MTQKAKAKILFEEARKVIGHDMGLLSITALGFLMLAGDKDATKKLTTIRAACEKRGVKTDV